MADVGPGDGAGAPEEVAARTIPVWAATLAIIWLVLFLAFGALIVRNVIISRLPQGAKFVTPGAISSLRNSVLSDPTNPQARLDLAYAYQQQGDFQLALREYAAALKGHPTNTAALYNSAVILLKLNQGEAAEVKLLEVLRVEPGHVLAAKQLGQYYASKGEYAKLVAMVRPVVKRAPQMADLQYLLGLGYEKTGDTYRALRHYRAALRYTPDLPEARSGVERMERGK